jgi:hypothetical protein
MNVFSKVVAYVSAVALSIGLSASPADAFSLGR